MAAQMHASGGGPPPAERPQVVRIDQSWTNPVLEDIVFRTEFKGKLDRLRDSIVWLILAIPN